MFTDDVYMLDISLKNVVFYEFLIVDELFDFVWLILLYEVFVGLCYMFGIIGNFKGVLYTYWFNLLYFYVVNSWDVVGIGILDIVLMVVFMFYVNSWGLVYSCLMVGVKLVLLGV